MIGSVYPGSNARMYSFSTTKRTGSSTYRASASNKTKKKKKLWYNFKELSAMILRAKTSGNAGQTVIMARSRLAQLKKKLKTGEYDDEELKSAILHAERMLRIAKKRQKHLKEEERAKNAGNAGQTEISEELDEEEFESALEDEEGLSKEEMQELMEEMERLMEESLDSFEEMDEFKELSEELLANWENLEPEDLELRKKKHRSDEMRDIIEADMKYLKALFERLEREKSNGAAGVFLELGGCEAPFAAAQMPPPQEGGSVDVSV